MRPYIYMALFIIGLALGALAERGRVELILEKEISNREKVAEIRRWIR